MKYAVKYLREIAVVEGIFGGYSFRGRIENEKDGEIHVVQMKDLKNNYSKIGNSLVMIKGDKINNKYYLQKQDILFIAKGANNYAFVYDLDLPVTVAASAFFVIRINTKIANPYFVAWYINQQKVQQYLNENMAGTYIPNININTVREIKIRLPTINVQNGIAKLNHLVQKEQEIIGALKEKRKILIETVLSNQLK